MKSGTILTSIALTLPVSRDDNQPSSPPNILHDIFHNVPYKPNSNLRRLVLSGYSLKPNVFELPHFKGLTSLDISHANGFQTSEADAELWSVLQIACIRLQHLSIEKVTEPVLWYLDSYLGLEILFVRGERFTADVQQMSAEMLYLADRKITHQLFSATLPRHRESLISYEGCNRASRSQSYMTYEFMLSLSVCKNLESLAFTLHISDLSSKNEHILNDGVSTNIKLEFYCYMCAFSDTPTLYRHRLYR